MHPLISQSLATRHLDDLAFAARRADLSRLPHRRPVTRRVGLALVDVGARLSRRGPQA